MNNRSISKAERADLCKSLDRAPYQQYRIGTLLRSAVVCEIVDTALVVRFKDVPNRDRLVAELEDAFRKAKVSEIVQEHLGHHLTIEPDLLIAKDYYIQTIREIMDATQIEESVRQPEYEIPDKATFETVVQYTEWFIAGGESRGNTHNRRHYRYDRYLTALNASGLSSRMTHRRMVHVDIGCGPGLFSWAFLDWAREQQISYSNIALYGYDHSEQMVALAHQICGKLRVAVGGYPRFSYSHDRDDFLAKLGVPHDGREDYVITLGHVLAGNQEYRDILEFVFIIEHVMRLQPSSKPLTVIVCDAVSERYRRYFEQGWDKLLQALRERGLMCNEVPTGTYTSSDRCVLLSRREV